jgi:hypothetical protein
VVDVHCVAHTTAATNTNKQWRRQLCVEVYFANRESVHRTVAPSSALVTTAQQQQQQQQHTASIYSLVILFFSNFSFRLHSIQRVLFPLREQSTKEEEGEGGQERRGEERKGEETTRTHPLSIIL